MVVQGFRAYRVVTGQETRQSTPLPQQKNTLLVGFRIHTSDCLPVRIYTGRIGGLDDLRCSKQNQFVYSLIGSRCTMFSASAYQN
jgi:hypothetical protein